MRDLSSLVILEADILEMPHFHSYAIIDLIVKRKWFYKTHVTTQIVKLFIFRWKRILNFFSVFLEIVSVVVKFSQSHKMFWTISGHFIIVNFLMSKLCLFCYQKVRWNCMRRLLSLERIVFISLSSALLLTSYFSKIFSTHISKKYSMPLDPEFLCMQTGWLFSFGFN